MNLSHIQLEKQDDNSFHLRDKKTGERFPVHKKHVNKALLDAIHQHFAYGGEVKHYDEGTPEGVPEPTVEPSSFWDDIKDAGTGIGRAAGDAVRRYGLAAGAGYTPDGPEPSLWERIQRANAGPEGVAARQAAAPNFTPGEAAQPEPNMSEELPPGAQLQSQPGQPTAPPPGIARPPGMGGGGVNGYEKDVSAAEKQAIEAGNKQAQLAGLQAQESLKAMQQHQVNREATLQQWNNRWQENQNRADKLSEDIANGKIEPGNWWATRDVGQKVTAGIALALGGLGQAFGGGPNQAIGLIQKNIEQDIDAQKANLNKKQGLLAHYIQQGHGIEEAKKLAVADNDDALAGQIAIAAQRNGDQAAQANAMKVAAGLKQQSAITRADIHAKAAKEALERQEMALKLKLADIKAPGGGGKPLQENTEGKLAAIKDAPAAIQNIRDKQANVGFSGYLGAITPEALHFGAQRELDNTVNATAGPMGIAAFPMARSESPELTNMTKDLFPTGWQSTESAGNKLDALQQTVERGGKTRLEGLLAGGTNPNEVNALRMTGPSIDEKLVNIVNKKTGEKGRVQLGRLSQYPDWERE